MRWFLMTQPNSPLWAEDAYFMTPWSHRNMGGLPLCLSKSVSGKEKVFRHSCLSLPTKQGLKVVLCFGTSWYFPGSLLLRSTSDAPTLSYLPSPLSRDLSSINIHISLFKVSFSWLNFCLQRLKPFMVHALFLLKWHVVIFNLLIGLLHKVCFFHIVSLEFNCPVLLCCVLKVF